MACLLAAVAAGVLGAPSLGVTEYVPVGIRAPSGGGEVPLDLFVPTKGEHRIADPASLMQHVADAWDGVVQDHQEGLVDPKQMHLPVQGLTGEEAWHHYEAGRDGVIDSGRFLLAFGMVPSVQTGGSPLYIAAALGDTKRILKLLKEDGADVDVEKVTDGTTPLHATAITCKPDAARVLIAEGANINAAGVNGITPLMMAATGGCLEVVEALLEAEGIELDLKHPFAGTTALHFAAEMGRVDVVKRLCSAGSDSNAEKKTGGTPLHTAADTNQSAAVRALLEHPCAADINRLLVGDSTPLYLAAQRGFVQVMEVLIEKGAVLDFIMPQGKFRGDLTSSAPLPEGTKKPYYGEKNTEVGNGATPLHAAAENNFPDAVDLLLRSGAKQLASMQGTTPLLISLQYRHPHIALRLLEEGVSAKINVKQPFDGQSPLFVSVLHRYHEVIDRMIALGADVNIETSRGDTPLGYALAGGDIVAAEKLLAAGADGKEMLQAAVEGGSEAGLRLVLQTVVDVDAQPKDTTALHTACLRGNLPAVKALLARGAQVDRRVKSTKATALMLAAARGHESILQVLLAEGADPAVRGGRELYWATPLYLAAQNGHAPCIARLLAAGASPDTALQKSGTSPLHVVCERKHEGALRALLKGGASPFTRNAAAATPLHAAAASGFTVGVQQLLDKDADPNAVDADGRTPLMAALQAGAPVHHLLPVSNVTYVVPATGFSAAHAALSASPPRPDVEQLIDILVARAPQVFGTPTDTAPTPLMLAAAQGLLGVVRQLLAAGPRIAVVANGRSTAVHAAVAGEHRAVLQALIDAGIDPAIPDAKGNRVEHKVRLLRSDPNREAKGKGRATPSPLSRLFFAGDANADGAVSRAELIKALATPDTPLASSLRLPQVITQEGESRKLFEAFYRHCDADGSRGITQEEFSQWEAERGEHEKEEEEEEEL